MLVAGDQHHDEEPAGISATLTVCLRFVPVFVV